MQRKEPLSLFLSDVSFGGLPGLCREILNETIAITGADFGNMQLLNAEGTSLEIAAQRGLNTDFLRHFESVPMGEVSSCCGRAAKTCLRAMIEDVEVDAAFSEHLEVARSVPFRAVQSTPLIGRKKKLLGVVSSHFREPRLPDEQQLENLDHYIRKASLLIETACDGKEKEERSRKIKIDASLFLHSMKFFQGLDDSDKKALIKIGAIREYSKGNDIFFYGDIADRMFILLNGWVKIYNVNNIDRESGIMLLTQGDEFGTEAIFGQGAYIYAARAETKAQILELPAAGLKKMARDCPDLADRIMRVLSEKIKQRQITEICLRHKKATQRVACLVLRLTSWMNGKGGTFRMPYKKSIAAAQLDMDQATFSRALMDMKDLGISTRESEITIRDFSLLANHCCLHCPMQSGQCAGRRI